MSDGERFEIGSRVVCADGDCGEVLRVVIDPVAQAVTHLAVGPRHRRRTGRLVPVDLVTSAGNEIELRCSKPEFDALLPDQDAELLPAATQAYEDHQDQVRTLAYYNLMAPGGIAGQMAGASQTARQRTFDRVPAGEAELRRGDQVEAKDGPIGRVQGLVVDPTDRHVTHVLLDEGHLWGKRQVAIPIGDVQRIDGAVRVDLTKEQVGDLESVDLEHPN